MATLLIRYSMLRIQMYVYLQKEKDKHIVQHYLVWVEEKYVSPFCFDTALIDKNGVEGFMHATCENVQKKQQYVFCTVHK
jgi:hypothetical protein